MKLVYFSWIRERLNKNEEEIALPNEVKTLGDLKTWMQKRDEVFEAVFEHKDIIRVAIDQEHVDDDAFDISGANEIAFFPPMTGG
ncbi:MAG: molybdopterin converting factor subunit 1 [Nitratireductor sp.]